jgi:nitroreductase
MIHNEVLDCIRARRSTRHFLEKQVEPELIEALLEASVWAPSGGKSQTWLFTAISKPDVLKSSTSCCARALPAGRPTTITPASRKPKTMRKIQT